MVSFALGLVLLSAFGELASAQVPPLASSLDPDARAADYARRSDLPLADLFLNVMSAEDCRRIIELCEEDGFNNIADSIDGGEVDNIYSQDIYVIDHGGKTVNHPGLWALIKPYIPGLAELVAPRKFRSQLWIKPNRTPHADWIFIRKYSPLEGSTRNSLKVHHDENEHTVVILLNDDYVGGGMLLIPPPPQPQEYQFDEAPTVNDSFRTYDWLNSQVRGNTTDALFLEEYRGSAVLYNHTVYHGIAPIESGARYAVSVFFDMPMYADAIVDYEEMGATKTEL